MIPGHFIFNVDKCVGCMACVVGCSITNNKSDSSNWRVVTQFNNFNHPDLPVYYYSLACNHCEKAPCMSGCPAGAYSRDETTGAVIHDQTKCTGCKYCTWLCPFDSPKYNNSSFTIEKCDFCSDLLKSGNKPSCVVACPTGALSYGVHDSPTSGDVIFTSSKTHSGIIPRIRIISTPVKSSKPEILGNQSNSLNENKLIVNTFANNKITAIKEWPLVIFSLVIPLMIAWIVSSFTHQIALNHFIFFPIILMSGGISILHLGKKTRFWRAVLNIKNSWLSREITSYILFIILSCIYCFTRNEIVGLSLILVSTGFLISLELVYFRVRPDTEFKLHSSSVIITALLWWSLITSEFEVVAITSALKVLLYLTRGFQIKQLMRSTRILFLACAIIHLYLFPENILIPLLLSFTGEAIDRIEFYNEAYVVSPATLINSRMKSFLAQM